MKADIHVVRIRASVVCAICGEPIPTGDLVHLLSKKSAAHVACDLVQRRAERATA